MVIGADKIFTGESWLADHHIIIENGIITSVENTSVESTLEIKHFKNCFIAPALIDIQIYGAYNKLFAVYPDPASLKLMHEYCVAGGAVLHLPTVATNTKEVFKKSVDAIRNYWSNGGKGIFGLHLEGPWLNKEKRGAHVAELIHTPTVSEVKELLEYGKDVIKMITIAPEVCSVEVFELLKSYKIILSAGHSNASYTEAINAFDHVDAVTHLFNAMSPLHHREPGMVGAVFAHQKIMASIIADGYHVDFNAIRLAKEIMKERLFIITDAVTETTEGFYKHSLNKDKYECNGTLSGSAINMHQSFLNLVNKTGIETGEALRMCSLYPAQVLKIDNKYGKIAPGYNAQFVVLNKELELVDVIL
jgi:N-acetylglucosamine-6-phosphate deacetylase